MLAVDDKKIEGTIAIIANVNKSTDSKNAFRLYLPFRNTEKQNMPINNILR